MTAMIRFSPTHPPTPRLSLPAGTCTLCGSRDGLWVQRRDCSGNRVGYRWCPKCNERPRPLVVREARRLSMKQPGAKTKELKA